MNREKNNSLKLPASGIPIIALFIALNVLLTHPLSINTETLRIGIGFLPIALAAAIYGPFWAVITAVIGDVIGAILFPSGPFFPGFTLSALLTGLIFGLFLNHREPKIRTMILPAILVGIIVNLGLDTFWLYIMYGQGLIAQIPFRAVKAVVNIVIIIALTPLAWRLIKPILDRNRGIK